MRLLPLVLVVLGCGSDHKIVAVDGAIDAGPVRTATGQHLVAHPSVIGGVTTDGFVAFSDYDAAGHTVAEIMPLAGGVATPIATSDGTGKPDIKYEVAGTVVFAWTDRGSRVASLTIWSNATGAIAKGGNIRPGRAAVTPDGAFILYERDITATTANVVAGPIAGDATILDSANTADNDCWQDTDLASVGAASAQRLVARYCSGTATAFTLLSITPDGTASSALSSVAEAAAYGASHVVWLETGGALDVAAADGTASHTLAADAADFVLSRDESSVVWLTADGAILSSAIDGGASQMIVAAPAAKLLGALSPDNQTVLFASQVVDDGTGYVAPYTDVLAGRAGQAPITLVPMPTSCPDCLYDSFTPDSQHALVLDPIDNSDAADAAGPIHAFALADGSSASTFGANVYSAVAPTEVGDPTVRVNQLLNGWVTPLQ